MWVGDFGRKGVNLTGNFRVASERSRKYILVKFQMGVNWKSGRVIVVLKKKREKKNLYIMLQW